MRARYLAQVGRAAELQRRELVGTDALAGDRERPSCSAGNSSVPDALAGDRELVGRASATKAWYFVSVVAEPGEDPVRGQEVGRGRDMSRGERKRPRG